MSSKAHNWDTHLHLRVNTANYHTKHAQELGLTAPGVSALFGVGPPVLSNGPTGGPTEGPISVDDDDERESAEVVEARRLHSLLSVDELLKMAPLKMTHV